MLCRMRCAYCFCSTRKSSRVGECLMRRTTNLFQMQHGLGIEPFAYNLCP